MILLLQTFLSTFLPMDSIFKTLSRVECSPVSVRLRIIHHNISVGLTNTNSRPTLFNDLCIAWERSWTMLKHVIYSLRSCSTHSWLRRESFIINRRTWTKNMSWKLGRKNIYLWCRKHSAVVGTEWTQWARMVDVSRTRAWTVDVSRTRVPGTKLRWRHNC
jgi:hypothetical protein